jgi:ketosteroid isomerase-like protein
MSSVEQLRELLTELYAAFSSGDPAAWVDHLTDDVLGVGTDPDEWWEGRDIVVKVGTAQVAQLANAGMQVMGGTPRIFDHGSILVAVDRPTLRSPDGQTIPSRFTVVALNNDDGLKIQHFHLSIGAENEEALGQELPTS